MSAMWYDDFDADLYKVVPSAEKLLAPVADVQMQTSGHPDRVTGRLNAPDLWNGYDGMLAFFRLEKPMVLRAWKSDFYAGSKTMVACTFEEAIRDTWVHSCILHVDGIPIWNSSCLQRDFDALMYDVRGWDLTTPYAVARARRRVHQSIAAAVAKLAPMVRP